MKTNLRFPDLALAFVASVGPLVAESAVSLELALLLGNLARRLVSEGRGEGDGCTGGGSGEIGALQRQLQTIQRTNY